MVSSLAATNRRQRPQLPNGVHSPKHVRTPSWLEQPPPPDRGDVQSQESVEPNPTAKPPAQSSVCFDLAEGAERAQGRIGESSVAIFLQELPSHRPRSLCVRVQLRRCGRNPKTCGQRRDVGGAANHLRNGGVAVCRRPLSRPVRRRTSRRLRFSNRESWMEWLIRCFRWLNRGPNAGRHDAIRLD